MDFSDIVCVWLVINAFYLFFWFNLIMDIDVRYDIEENILKKKKDFFISICPLQYDTWKEEKINNAEKIILIVFVSIASLPFTIFIFLLMSLLLLLKLSVYGFMKMFGAPKPQWNEWWG